MSEPGLVTVPEEDFALILAAAAMYCSTFTMADHMELGERITLRVVEELVAKYQPGHAR